MTRAFAILLFFLLSAQAFSQTVATINSKPVSSKEFIWMFRKNNEGSATASYERLYAYLQLYINFKLKVLEAKALKMDRDTAYLNEVDSYEQVLRSGTRLDTRKEEFEFIMNEYRDGVLMFNISEKKVWAPEGDAILLTVDEQRTIEEDWMKALRRKYQIRINENELRKLVRPLR